MTETKAKKMNIRIFRKKNFIFKFYIFYFIFNFIFKKFSNTFFFVRLFVIYFNVYIAFELIAKSANLSICASSFSWIHTKTNIISHYITIEWINCHSIDWYGRKKQTKNTTLLLALFVWWCAVIKVNEICELFSVFCILKN